MPVTMYNPVSTYRVQFHQGFTFSDFEKNLPYITKLGIRTIYASPIFEAVPGSMHGYDVTDPLRINPEIGTLPQLRSISKKLKKAGIGWLQDIVPNHMAFHTNNKWLMDVLENGRHSAYAALFDISWDSPIYNGKLMVPFLGKPLDEAIAAGELKLVEAEKPFLEYFGQRYPVNSESLKSQNAPVKKISKEPELLLRLADEQFYQLCHWRETERQINFRRFFTVNSLICLNMQDKRVFDRYHGLIKKLVREGIFQGLRVDHIDGLYDPETYLKRLRELAGDDTYIIVEKILEDGENFADNWPIQGNTGYDFLATINNFFTCPNSKSSFSKFYKKIDPAEKPIHRQIFEKKQLILDSSMQGELDNLLRLFVDLKLADTNELEAIGPDVFKKAIASILVYCPVYRFYGNLMPLPEADAVALENLLKKISNEIPELSSVNDVMENCLLLKPKVADEDYRHRALHFYQRLMQFTGPLMAKGIEDTLMYTYNRFIDHNEVGDSPASFGLKAKELDNVMQERQRLWPISINASSTHDTKRGEDVRARLNVLSDLAEEWLGEVEKWQKMNAGLKTNGAPDVNDEYFIYQTLAGAHPMPGRSGDDFENRLKDYLEKALREGKRHSNWAEPNEAYESATKKFAAALLNPKSDFGERFGDFHRRVADFGIINSLAQTLLKYTLPGVPDLYQGSELWNLSLVDPDNRRPVDYTKRAKYLDKGFSWQKLWDDRYNGQIKAQLIAKLLKVRDENAEAFEKGEYIPIKIKGKFKENVFAFARQFKSHWHLTIIPLHLATVLKDTEAIASFDWEDTRIIMPEAAPLSWHNLLSDQEGYSEKVIKIKTLFTVLPLALIRLTQSGNERKAGVLMHITSLPSSFGVGDIGPESYKFVDFLHRNRQHYWQMLPVNPIDGGSGFSPYSSTSAMAGNALLISPELLMQDGLLTADDLKPSRIKTAKVEFEQAIKIKKQLFDLAYLNFLKNTDRAAFEEFKITEAWWLDDFALYQSLKDRFNGAPWYNWPGSYKLRHKAHLQDLAGEIAIDQIKWRQYIFAKQWSSFKQYCQAKDITLLGDMPFYISYDSVDVWSNPALFKLDGKGKIKGVAGVPPDYFSLTGQLWGMPVYNWEKLKSLNYDWWIKRVRRNLLFFDKIRLDHFRAFSQYWEVPGGSENAINGSWEPGPGADFLNQLKSVIGELPFVAEDLGEIDENVYKLRDRFGLPGMRVLQFAFDEAMPVSEHIPHNYTTNSFAYTGTHDNNTIKGWYEKDINQETQTRVKEYVRGKLEPADLHRTLIEQCYASSANTVIIPIQDVLGLDESARMNVPSSPKGNWTWKLDDELMKEKFTKYLSNLCIKYNR